MGGCAEGRGVPAAGGRKGAPCADAPHVNHSTLSWPAELKVVAHCHRHLQVVVLMQLAVPPQPLPAPGPHRTTLPIQLHQCNDANLPSVQ